MIKKYEKTLKATGEDGEATAEATAQLFGAKQILKVVVDYTSSASTLDVVLTDADEAITDTILKISNADTDKAFYPVVAAAKAADGSASALTEVAPIAEAVKIKVEGANGDDIVTVRIFAESEV